MQLDISSNSLPVYEALASDVRLQILRILCDRELSITQLSEELHLSKAITTKHVQKLESTNLIRSKKIGLKKIPRLAVDTIEINFPTKIYHSYSMYTSMIQLGHYTNFEVFPTCGLATPDCIVGKLDDPLSFVEPERVNASLVWFSQGSIEYKIPNNLTLNQTPQMLEISLEMASEFPVSNNIWPSDIEFFINNTSIGVWTCPGNFSDVRGFYTPKWWEDNLSQYGLLKHIRLNHNNCTIDGELLSNHTLSDVNLFDSNFIDFKIAAGPDSMNKGGVTLFGRGFGNHDQDIVVKLYYSDNG